MNKKNIQEILVAAEAVRVCFSTEKHTKYSKGLYNRFCESLDSVNEGWKKHCSPDLSVSTTKGEEMRDAMADTLAYAYQEFLKTIVVRSLAENSKECLLELGQLLPRDEPEDLVFYGDSEDYIVPGIEEICTSVDEADLDNVAESMLAIA